MKHKLKPWSSDPVLGKDFGRGRKGGWDVWTPCSSVWVWLSKCQVVAELRVPDRAPNSLLLKRLKCRESVYGRGQSCLNTGKSNGTRQVQTWLLGLSAQNPSFGTSWLLTHLHYSWSAWLFPVSFKIKPARQFPGVQDRSQNAEQM